MATKRAWTPPALDETMRRLRSGELQRSLAAMGPARDPLRDRLANHLFEAEQLALEIGERSLARVVEALRECVERNERQILENHSGEGSDERRFVGWADKKIAERSKMIFPLRKGEAFVHVRGSTNEPHRVVEMLLQLPWKARLEESTGQAIRILAHASWLGLANGRGADALERDLRHSVESPRANAKRDVQGRVRALLRALGMKDDAADKLVRRKKPEKLRRSRPVRTD